MKRWLEWQTMDRWRPRGTKPPCCCWHCSDAVGCVLVCGGGPSLSTHKKSTQKNTTNKEASRDTQHSDAKPQRTILQELRQVCVYRYAEMRAKGNVSVRDTPWQSSSSSAHSQCCIWQFSTPIIFSLIMMGCNISTHFMSSHVCKYCSAVHHLQDWKILRCHAITLHTCHIRNTALSSQLIKLTRKQTSNLQSKA